MRDTQLLDNTLRDGGYVLNFQFSKRDTRVIAQSLDAAGISLIEVGHGLGLGASCAANGVALEPDVEYIRAAREAVKSAEIGCFFIPGIGSISDLQSAADNGLDFVRVGSEVHDLDACGPYVEAALDAGLKVYLNLMKTYAVPAPQIPEIVQRYRDWPLEGIYVVDSAGCMQPSEVREYVKALRQATRVSVGFHGHNNLGMANGNSLEAVVSGATLVDGSLCGMGRSAGNAQTEVVANLLTRNGWIDGVDVFQLLDAADRWVRPLLAKPQGIASLDIAIGMSRFHSGHLPRFRKVLDKYDVDLIRLIYEVSRYDCVHPSDVLIEDVARDLNRLADT